MAFPVIAALARCQMPACAARPRAAVRLHSGDLSHVCLPHLVDVLLGGDISYPVLELTGIALRPPARELHLRVVPGTG